MVCQRGGVHDVLKLLDFGLVLPVVEAGDDETLSHEGVIAGTPHICRPNRRAGRRSLDVRSDIYSLGALAYFLLTGRPPFLCASPLGTLAAHLCAPPTPPSSGHIDLPADLEAIVLRCLAKSPDDRFADAQTLEKALATCRCVEEWSEQQAADWWRAHRESDTDATSHHDSGNVESQLIHEVGDTGRVERFRQDTRRHGAQRGEVTYQQVNVAEVAKRS